MWAAPLAWLALLLALYWPALIHSLSCKVGYGQRGLNYENGIGWTRLCNHTSVYCFEAVTTDVNQARKLFEYPWDSYYAQFYVRSCGGDLGTPVNYHPFKALPKATRHVLGMVKLNITTPALITGQGGPENVVEMMLSYKCKTNLCERLVTIGAASPPSSAIPLLVACLLSASLFLTSW